MGELPEESKSNNRAGGRAMNIIKRIKMILYRLCTKDPVLNCPIYKNEGCALVDSPYCTFPDCTIVHKYLCNNVSIKENETIHFLQNKE